MAQRSAAENLRRLAQKKAARLEARRRDLRERYPNIPHQTWCNLGDGIGLGGVGGKALREWLRSLGELISCCHATRNPQLTNRQKTTFDHPDTQR